MQRVPRVCGKMRSVLAMTFVLLGMGLTIACTRTHRCVCQLQDASGNTLEVREFLFTKMSKKKAEEACQLQSSNQDEAGNTWSCFLVEG